MSPIALMIVLSAAVMHASWNAVVKGAQDRALTLAAVASMHALGGAAILIYAGLPTNISWLMLLASTALHYIYYVLLFRAYQLGDLSQVYPIARGMAPALVACGSYLLLDEVLSQRGVFGIVLISVGIGLIALQRGAVNADKRAVGVAALLGLTIAAYSVADGAGVRWSENRPGYMGWLFFLEAPVVLSVLLPRIARRRHIDLKVFGIGAIGGVLALAAYAMVLYATTIAPVGAVSAVRESSVIIAALIGVIFFKERPWGMRLAAAIVVAAGVVLLASS